jgi:hypothetical protein
LVVNGVEIAVFHEGLHAGHYPLVCPR